MGSISDRQNKRRSLPDYTTPTTNGGTNMSENNNGATMKTGERRLMWDGTRNNAVELVSRVAGGWLVRMANGMLVGPVVEGAATLR